MARARARGRAEDFHEWRKQVKYLRQRAESESGLAPTVRDALLQRIDARRKEHQRDALGLGRRLYSEKPSTLGQRLGRLWDAAA